MNPLPNQSVWNSLEIVKLLVSGLTPLLVLVVGWVINRALKRIERIQWADQKIVEKRLAIYSELAPLLNDILCYFIFIGCWKELSPVAVVALKRTTDKIVHVNAPLFSSDFLRTYNEFIDLCFSTYSGWGHNAKLKTPSIRRKQVMGASWESEWDDCFVPEEGSSDPNKVKAAYSSFMSTFACELGVGLSTDSMPAGQIPGGIC